MPKNILRQLKKKSKNDNPAPSKKPNNFIKSRQIRSLVLMKLSVALKIKRASSTAGIKSKKRKSWETFERSTKKFMTP